MRRVTWIVASLVVASSTAHAAEICGNGIDDPDASGHGNGQTDEGCYPALRTGVCESPLSCMDTGWVSWSTGSLHYDVPADVAPKSPFGPEIGLRRFYTSMYAPPATPTGVDRTPLGPRWQHNYMSWVDTPNPNTRVIHTPQGEDVLATYVWSDGTWSYYGLQAGQHFAWFRQRVGGAREYELHTLTGESMIYNSAGELAEVWDRVAAPNTNKLMIAWVETTPGGPRAVGFVTDATGMRRLRFNYSGALLATVNFQLQIAGEWTTYHTTTYGFAGGMLSTVNIGGQLAQTNTYSGGYLVQIRDGENHQLVTFAYGSSKPGQVARIDTVDGTVGFDFASSRCTGQTALYFNQSGATSCTVDGDCGTGLLCGGKTAAGPGSCFRAARCLTIDATSGESLVTRVDPIGPPGETCTGTCAAVTRYMWNSTLDVQSATDALENTTSITYDNGLPTQIVTVDKVTPTNTSTTWLFYDAVDKGRLTEIRRKSAVSSDLCSAINPSGCARTRFVYDPASGEIAQKIDDGWSPDGGLGTAFEYTTTYQYNSRGQILRVDGPLTASNDVTAFLYMASTDPRLNGFLMWSVQYPDSSTNLIRWVNNYDFWGNPIDWTEPDGTRSCRSYDPARNVLVKTSEEMNPANSSCATDDLSDLIERFAWDSNLRLTRITRPDGSCTIYEYDARGRLADTKRRDDCNPASAGPREHYVYDQDGLMTEVDAFDAAGVMTRKQLQSYYDSRQVQSIIDPVDATKVSTLTYDPRGAITDLDAPGNLGHAKLTIDGLDQLTKIEQSRSSSVVDSWLLAHDPLGQPSLVTDPDNKKLSTSYDDLGRIALYKVPDQLGFRFRRDEEGNVIGVIGPATTDYTRDALGRVLTANGPRGCNSSPELQATYDRPPAACPIAGGCNNLAGRLSYVRVTLLCSSAFTDNALDQWTYYSYDAAGRVVAEYITDDTGRAVPQTYTWTKNGDLASVTMPSSATIGWTYGSTASNADTDLVTAVWRTSSSTPMIDGVTWKPFGPLEQYNRMDTISGSRLVMKERYDLAYRPTEIRLDAQNGTGPYFRVGLLEDAKGRVTIRDYYPSDPQIAGVFDSYFKYDDEDRLLCEMSAPGTSCPTNAVSLKNNMVGGFTGAGDRTTLLHSVPGSGGGISNVFAIDTTRHRITAVTQGDGATPLGTINFGYDNLGGRIADDNLSAAMPYDRRDYTYDWRRNVVGVTGMYPVAGTWHGYHVRSGFDANNRRVFKAFEDTTTHQQKQWFFSYDPLDRLTEVRYIPDAADPSTFSTYQLFWLERTLVAYWQTDLPTGATSKRYVESDESGRPVRMHAWIAGNSPVVWSINPDAWGMDNVVLGAGIYQPIVFAGQYRDPETAAYLNDGTTVYRPGLVLNGARTYDPFTGTYLQVDPNVLDTFETYTYAQNNPVGMIDPDGRAASELHCVQVPAAPDPDYPDAISMAEHCWYQPTGEFAFTPLRDPTPPRQPRGDPRADREFPTKKPPRPPKDEQKKPYKPDLAHKVADKVVVPLLIKYFCKGSKVCEGLAKTGWKLVPENVKNEVFRPFPLQNIIDILERDVMERRIRHWMP